MVKLSMGFSSKHGAFRTGASGPCQTSNFTWDGANPCSLVLGFSRVKFDGRHGLRCCYYLATIVRALWLVAERARVSCNERVLLARLARCPRHIPSVFNLIADIHVMVNWQLSEKGIRWPVSNDCIATSSVQLIEVACSFKLSAD